MHLPLSRSFFEPSADLVAPRLLGHLLLRRTRTGWAGGPIVEAEAYLASDPACHSFGGKTRRNNSMFGPPGYSYVYLIYGMHFCFNTVCGPEGCGEAVLIRAIEATLGLESMFRRRKVSLPVQLTSGPAKLCQALHIRRDLDGADICAVDSPIYVAENPAQKDYLRSHGPMIVGRRIGISKAADLPLRFYLDQSRFVSRR